MSFRWTTAEGEPTLADVRALVAEVARDLDPGSRYVGELRAVLDAADDLGDYLARLADLERVARFQADGSAVSRGERGRSWVDGDVWADMGALERTLANLLTGETRMMWGGEGAADFARFADALGAHPEPVRALSVPCSTGKEAYSLAIAGHLCGLDVRVTGVDRQPAYVERARLGRLVPHGRDWEHPRAEEFLARGDDGRARVRPHVLERCAFETGDVLTGELPAGPFDLVSCRNLLGYFRGDALETAWRNVAARVRPAGLLLLDGFATGAPEMARIPELLAAEGFARLFDDARYFRSPPSAHGQELPPGDHVGRPVDAQGRRTEVAGGARVEPEDEPAGRIDRGEAAVEGREVGPAAGVDGRGLVRLELGAGPARGPGPEVEGPGPVGRSHGHDEILPQGGRGAPLDLAAPADRPVRLAADEVHADLRDEGAVGGDGDGELPVAAQRAPGVELPGDGAAGPLEREDAPGPVELGVEDPGVGEGQVERAFAGGRRELDRARDVEPPGDVAVGVDRHDGLRAEPEGPAGRVAGRSPQRSARPGPEGEERRVEGPGRAVGQDRGHVPRPVRVVGRDPPAGVDPRDPGRLARHPGRAVEVDERPPRRRPPREAGPPAEDPHVGPRERRALLALGVALGERPGAVAEAEGREAPPDVGVARREPEGREGGPDGLVAPPEPLVVARQAEPAGRVARGLAQAPLARPQVSVARHGATVPDRSGTPRRARG